MKSRVIAAALFLLAAIPAASQDFLSADGPLKDLKKRVGIEQRLNEQIPLDLVFTDEDGRRLPLRRFFHGKPVIFVPVYFDCPMLCTMVLDGVTNTLTNLRFSAGHEFEVVTFSFDPKDTPAKAHAKKDTYVKRYGRPGASGGWHFLTGDEASIKKLTDALGFRYEYDPKTQQYAHGAAIMVATPDGKVSRYFYGIGYDAKDLRLGLVDASQNRIGSLSDQIMLLCYSYDAGTGKYAVMAMGAVRIGGVVTLLIVGGFITFMLLHERKRRMRKHESQS